MDELVAEYRAIADRMNEIAHELGHKHDVHVETHVVPYSRTLTRGDRLEYSHLSPIFKKVL